MRLTRLFLFAILTGLLATRGASEPTVAALPDQVLSPEAMRADVETLAATLAAVHPNLHFHLSPAAAAKQRDTLLAGCAAPRTARYFSERLSAYVTGFHDEHTVAYPLPGMLPKEEKPTTRVPWRFERLAADVGYIDFRTMRDRPAWQRFLETTFRTLNAERVPALIVDLRHNPGGDSTLGEDLLGYLLVQPYRPISRKSWRFSPLFLRQMKTADPWGLEMGDPAQEPPPEYRRLFAQNPTTEFKALMRERVSPRVRQILTRHAPHWLGAAESPAPPTEILSLEFTPAAPPPPPIPRYTGRVCFLIGPATFSSAVILANTVEDFSLAPLIGEETKPCNQFGEPYRFQLPCSGIWVDVATAQYVRANGDAANPHGVRPTLRVAPTNSPGRDAVLDAALAWAKHAGSVSP